MRGLEEASVPFSQTSRVAAPLKLETATVGTILISPDFGDVSCDYAAMDAIGQLVADAHILSYSFTFAAVN